MRWTFTEEIGQGMHNMMSHIGMEHDPNHGQHDQDHHYNGNDAWVQIGYPSSHQTSPINEYQNYQYMSAPNSLPLQPSYATRMLPPAQHSQPQLLPLIMPSHQTWPSMLTNPAGYMAPPVAIPHSAPPMSAPKLPKIHAPSPRKTLTDNDRRRMCQYHEEHPTVKQTEIGAMFGVERSTVSKVLRQKEKYLFPEDRSESPVKKSKGKVVDIDRALSSWARKHQDQGLPLTDAAIREKARIWAATVGNTESHVKATSAVWLEKFKQKNNIGKGGKLVRRSSEASISEATYSHENSAAQTPSGYSPTSPSESPVSGSKVGEDGQKEGDEYISGSYRQPHSQSSTSLSSNYTDGGPSPGTPFNFSPETTQGPFPSSRLTHLPPPSANTGLYQPRPRSQTFPMLNIDPTFNQNPDNVTPKFPGSNSGSSMESPNELPSAYSIDSQISSPTLHHRSSNGSMPPLSSTGSTGSSMLLTHGLSPASPTQDDARRGLETFLNYVKSPNAHLKGIDESDYMTVMKLSETLKNQNLNGSGQLHCIQEQDAETAQMKFENRMSVGA